jgi:hypothetical protein
LVCHLTPSSRSSLSSSLSSEKKNKPTCRHFFSLRSLESFFCVHNAKVNIWFLLCVRERNVCIGVHKCVLVYVCLYVCLCVYVCVCVCVWLGLRSWLLASGCNVLLVLRTERCDLRVPPHPWVSDYFGCIEEKERMQMEKKASSVGLKKDKGRKGSKWHQSDMSVEVRRKVSSLDLRVTWVVWMRSCTAHRPGVRCSCICTSTNYAEQ